MTKSFFECLHSGDCCERPYTQISLTIGDIVRIADYRKKPVGFLFDQGFVGIRPFFLKSDTVFSCEPGLVIPCGFRLNRRCEVYEARPLNCRLFPYWILSEVDENKLKEFIDESYECVHSVRLDQMTRERYKSYVKNIVRLIEDEGGITDKIIYDIFQQNNLNKNLDLSDCKRFIGFNRTIEKLKGQYEGVRLKKEIESARIGIAIEMINIRGYQKHIPEIVKAIQHLSKNQVFADLFALNRIETEKSNNK